MKVGVASTDKMAQVTYKNELATPLTSVVDFMTWLRSSTKMSATYRLSCRTYL